jgi:histidinol-phosphate phosphatase family protein
MAMNTPSRTAVFLDKDGTLVENVPYNVDPALLRFTPRAPEALRSWAAAGHLLVVVSNQPGMALGYFDRRAWMALRHALMRKVEEEVGVQLTDVLACPHAPSPRQAPGCLCRKPAPGLLRQAAATHHIDLKRSWMVGDILDDVEAGHRAGCQSILLDVGHETEWRLSPLRRPVHRAADLMDAASWILGTRQPAEAPTPPSCVAAS